MYGRVHRLAQSQNGKRYYSAVYNDRDTEVINEKHTIKRKTAASSNAYTHTHIHTGSI